MFSFTASILSALFGLYCLVWSLALGTTSHASLRGGGAFIGVLLLLLAYTHLRLYLKKQ
jgi:hypothetical protein